MKNNISKLILLSFLCVHTSYAQTSNLCKSLLSAGRIQILESFDARENILPTNFRKIGLQASVLRGSEIGESASYTYANNGRTNNFLLNINFPDNDWGIEKLSDVVGSYIENKEDKKLIKFPLIKNIIELQQEINSNLYVRIQSGVQLDSIESFSFVYTYGETRDARFKELKILTVPKDLQYESYDPNKNTKLARLAIEFNIDESTLRLTKSSVVTRPEDSVLVADSNSSEIYSLTAKLNFNSSITEIIAPTLASELFFGKTSDKELQKNLGKMTTLIRQIFPRNKIILTTMDQKRFQYNGIHHRWDEI